jgi:hypothetical protein
MVTKLATIALLLTASPGLSAGRGQHPADAVCADHDALLSSLASQYKEAPREIGLAGDGSVVELTTTADGRTWTLLITRSDGTTCIIAAGEAWKQESGGPAGQPI